MQQGRMDALEVGGEAHAGERREAQWPQLKSKAHGSGARSLAGEFDAAAVVSPHSDAEPGYLEAQAEQLWREVAAAQATLVWGGGSSGIHGGGGEDRGES